MLRRNGRVGVHIDSHDLTRVCRDAQTQAKKRVVLKFVTKK